MFNVTMRRSFLAGVAGLCVATAMSIALPCPAAEPSIDPRLKALVDKHLRRDPNYKPGDILSRGNVEPIYNELIELKLSPADESDGRNSVYLRDGDYLVQLLRATPRGREFMRQASRLPEAYDRLERLSWLPVGRSWLQQLVAAENGAEIFAGMLTDEGMRKVVESLGNDPRAQNFHLPTGHIHTEAQLLARLQRTIESHGRTGKQVP